MDNFKKHLEDKSFSTALNILSIALPINTVISGFAVAL